MRASENQSRQASFFSKSKLRTGVQANPGRRSFIKPGCPVANLIKTLLQQGGQGDEASFNRFQRFWNEDSQGALEQTMEMVPESRDSATTR
jgi:hypothetical protein